MDKLAPRILNLPADVRAALARVDGLGWAIRPPWTDGAPTTTETIAVRPDMRWLPVGSAFWPGNPAASVAAVTGWPLASAYSAICTVLLSGAVDDSVAALSIIEAHVASRGPS